MINYNPETVSTDYDECDRMYFEELNRERVLDIYNRDSCDGVIVSVGGQIPNGLAIPLADAGVKLLGTSAKMIDNAEDRNKFSAMIDEIGVQQPRWLELTDTQSAIQFAKDVGYPGTSEQKLDFPRLQRRLNCFFASHFFLFSSSPCPSVICAQWSCHERSMD
jgi:carbamoyl-phosphate synthase (ammonia)